jgi:hypothetical protein
MWISIGMVLASFHVPLMNLLVEEIRMNDKNWRELCATIVEERDPEKLLSLVNQLNEVLDDPKLKLEDAPETKRQ